MVDAVLEIMQKAVIPWTNVVEKLVQHYLEMEGPKYVDTVTLVLFIAIVFFSLISRISIIFFSRQELLKESFVLMEIRKLLRSYGIRNFNLSNRTQIMVKKTKQNIDLLFFSIYILLSSLSLITFALQTLIRYILKQDLPTSLDDSLMLAGAYKFPTPEIHYFYVVQLTTQGKVGKRIWTPENA